LILTLTLSLFYSYPCPYPILIVLLGSLLLAAGAVPLVHVSLSRPFTARHEQLDGLVASLREQLATARTARLCLQGAGVFMSDGGSRTFGAALVASGAAAVCGWITAVDTALAAWDKPVYCSPAVPHASLGNVNGDASARAEAAGLAVCRAEAGQRVVPGYRTQVDSLLLGGGGADEGSGGAAVSAKCGGRVGADVGSGSDKAAAGALPPAAGPTSWLADAVVLRAGDRTYTIPLLGGL
jgi:hypothetical protein